ncbi:BLUF domain-containing protein [Aurantimonas marianensis]|uniref:BLUF domain-containing protein n=1 Tax=Aurantimonas marianensis TaxID=2920428 RepID=A0A9X2KEB8_9HYPH|nr:BLUF domain-containing protein [Aurantimonas marianensis]
MNYLVYVSQARQGLDAADLRAILSTSRNYNPLHGISGMLLFASGRDGRRGSFMQLLEGDRRAIETLRTTIFADPRHHTKIVVEQGEKPERDFADWSMAFRNVTREDLTGYPEFADLGSDHFFARCEAGATHRSLEFLKDFWAAEPREDVP